MITRYVPRGLGHLRPQPLLPGMVSRRPAGRVPRSHRLDLRPPARPRGRRDRRPGRRTGPTTCCPAPPGSPPGSPAQVHINPLPDDRVHRVQHPGPAVQRPAGPPRVQPRRRPQPLRHPARRPGPGHPVLPDPAARHPRLPALLPVHRRPGRLRRLDRPRTWPPPAGSWPHPGRRACASPYGPTACPGPGHARLHGLRSARARLPGQSPHRLTPAVVASNQRLAPADPGHRQRSGSPTTRRRRTSSTCSSAARPSASMTPPPPGTAPSSATPQPTG